MTSTDADATDCVIGPLPWGYSPIIEIGLDAAWFASHILSRKQCAKGEEEVGKRSSLSLSIHCSVILSLLLLDIWAIHYLAAPSPSVTTPPQATLTFQ